MQPTELQTYWLYTRGGRTHHYVVTRLGRLFIKMQDGKRGQRFFLIPSDTELERDFDLKISDDHGIRVLDKSQKITY